VILEPVVISLKTVYGSLLLSVMGSFIFSNKNKKQFKKRTAIYETEEIVFWTGLLCHL
jgi:hypothetical protein